MRRLPAFLPGVAIVSAMLLVVVLSSGPAATQADGFNPTLEASLSDSTPSAHADLRYDFHISAPDPNFGDIVSFIPPAFAVASDADVPDGAIAGELYADVTLGLLNTACNTALPVEMVMYEATTDLEDRWYGDAGYLDIDGDGILEFVEHYPGFLSEIFPGVQPILRIYGQALVTGYWNVVQFLVFEPGTIIPTYPKFDEALGYPVFAILNNPFAGVYVNPISDFCTPLTVDNAIYGLTHDNPVMPGDQTGYTLLTNPPTDGAHVGTSFVRSLWDADGDGIENNLDPCRYQPDAVWDPRSSTTAGDADNDGLPATCDPNDNAHNADVDGDGYVNRLDFCPFIYDFAQDSDGDDVGDQCDHNPFDPSDGGLSQRYTVCTTSLIVIGAGGPDPTPPPCPEGPDTPIFAFYGPPPIAGLGQEIAFVLSVSRTPYGFGGTPGVGAEFVVEGANSTSGQCVSDDQGYCEMSYVGSVLGTDTITVTVPGHGYSQIGTVSWEEPPTNDLFANAYVIDALPFDYTGNPHLAGREPGEVHCGGSSYQGSTWYRFTPASDAMMHLTTEGMYADVGVFIGNTPDALETIYCSASGYYDDYSASPASSQSPSQIRHHFFELKAGITYSISIDVFTFFFDGGGDLTVSLDAVSGVSVGDMNCDGAVNVVDALIILRVDTGQPVPACDSAWGDVDCSGQVSPLDALWVLLYDSKRPGFKGEWPGCLPIGWSG